MRYVVVSPGLKTQIYTWLMFLETFYQTDHVTNRGRYSFRVTYIFIYFYKGWDNI